MGKRGNADFVGGVPISEKSTSFEKKDINFCTSSDVNASASALARFSISVFTSSLLMLVCWIEEGVGGNEVIVDELLNAAGTCAWRNQYAHLVGLRESTRSKQGGRADISQALFVLAVAAAPGLGQVIELSI
jgi:hypothetical protein